MYTHFVCTHQASIVVTPYLDSFLSVSFLYCKNLLCQQSCHRFILVSWVDESLLSHLDACLVSYLLGLTSTFVISSKYVLIDLLLGKYQMTFL